MPLSHAYTFPCTVQLRRRVVKPVSPCHLMNASCTALHMHRTAHPLAPHPLVPLSTWEKVPTTSHHLLMLLVQMPPGTLMWLPGVPTLPAASQPLNGGDAIAARPLAGIGGFNAETLVSDVQDIPIDQAVVSTRGLADIRSITGESANMRSGPGTDFETVDQLTRGTDVEILGQRGAWVELRDLNTGQTGWMADWLVTAAN